MTELNSSSHELLPRTLYYKAIQSAKNNYANMHVYPYTYLGHYFYRNRLFREAMEAWANAADVISKLAIFHIIQSSVWLS